MRTPQRRLAMSHLFAVVTILGLAATSALAQAQTQPSGSTTNPAVTPAHDGLIEESTFLTVTGPKGSYRLEVAIVRPAKAEGRLPVALITHGKARSKADMADTHAYQMLPQARDFAHRGFLSVAVVRRGFGSSDGTPGVATNAPYAKCSFNDLQHYFRVESDDLEGALRAIAAHPQADAARVIAVGSSVGGGAVLALAARRPKGLLAVVNLAGGMRLTDANGALVCAPETPISALATFGSARLPTMWVYSENDYLSSKENVQRLHEAYTKAGGLAELHIIPPLQPNGHFAFDLAQGRAHWLPHLDQFLRANNLPTWNVGQVDALMRNARLNPASRKLVETYFSLHTPKVLVEGGGFVTYAASSRDIAGARTAGLEQCRQRAGQACRIVAENFAPRAR
jgi:pimeloyl-ACP methyl ester carboxylesterase